MCSRYHTRRIAKQTAFSGSMGVVLGIDAANIAKAPHPDTTFMGNISRGGSAAFMSRHKSFLLLILATAFLLRFVAAIGLEHYLKNTAHRQFLIAGDASGYWELGKRIAAFQEYAVHEPPRRVMRTPGFPALLAVPIGLAGASTFAARLVLAVVGTVACWLVYLLATQLFDENVGLVAAVLTGFSPTMVGFSVLLLSETLFAATLVASLVVMALLTKRNANHAPPIWLAVVAGIAFAAACYVRPSWMLVMPLYAVMVVCLSKDRRRVLALAVAILAGFLLAWSPWVIRNYRTTGQIVVTTLWVGPSLYDGLNPAANGDSNMTFFDRDKLMSTMSEYEMDQHYRRKAMDFVQQNPGRTAELAMLKLIRYWKPWPNADQFNKAWHKLAVAAFFVPLAALAVWGAWLNRRQPWVLLLAVFPIFYFSAIHSIFVGSLRYRLPAEYPVSVVAAAAICEAIRRRKKSVSTSVATSET